jgi:hypothetical protein
VNNLAVNDFMNMIIVFNEHHLCNLQSNEIPRFLHGHFGFRYVQMDGELCQFWSNWHNMGHATTANEAMPGNWVGANTLHPQQRLDRLQTRHLNHLFSAIVA